MKESFINLVGEKFASWDPNRDGRLSADEVDRLIADPSIPVKNGVFEISLKDFVRVFQSISYETSAPLTAAVNQKRRGRA